MASRMIISNDSTALPCKACGHLTLHVARLITDEGTLVGETTVCTTCHPHRPGAPDSR